jgi:hypothetical protein
MESGSYGRPDSSPLREVRTRRLTPSWPLCGGLPAGPFGDGDLARFYEGSASAAWEEDRDPGAEPSSANMIPGHCLASIQRTPLAV